MRKIAFCIHVTYWKFIYEKNHFLALLFSMLFSSFGAAFFIIISGENFIHTAHSHTEAFLPSSNFPFRFSLFFLSFFCKYILVWNYFYLFIDFSSFFASPLPIDFFSLSFTDYFIHIFSDSLRKIKKR